MYVTRLDGKQQPSNYVASQADGVVTGDTAN